MSNIKEIYIQSKGKVIIKPKDKIKLNEIIDIYTEPEFKKKIEQIEYEISDLNTNNTYIISLISVIDLIKTRYSFSTITVIGDSEAVVNFKDKQLQNNTRFIGLRVAIVCVLLFVGAITAIINFHSDVNMRVAHQTIYKAITGIQTETPYLLQIPYSLGIGVGMSVFFNHIFKKRINNEPSPLEVEMYLYQQNMDEYIKNNNQNNK